MVIEAPDRIETLITRVRRVLEAETAEERVAPSPDDEHPAAPPGVYSDVVPTPPEQEDGAPQRTLQDGSPLALTPQAEERVAERHTTLSDPVGDAVLVACKQLLALDAFTRRRKTAQREVRPVVRTLFGWIKRWMEAGRAGERRLALNGKRFLVGWAPDTGPVVRPVEQMNKDAKNDTRTTYLGLRGHDALECLEERIQQAGPVASTMQMAQVFDALRPYKDGATPLPVGVTDLMIAFLARSAAECAWAALAEHDPRLPGLLLGAYLTDMPFSELGRRAGGISAGRVSQLIAGALQFLHDRLPGDALTKEQAFPIEELRRGRAGRGSEAQQKVARARWEEATSEERLDWLDAMDTGASAPEARKKQRAAAKCRHDDPERGRQVDTILAQGRRQRWGA